MKRKIFIVSGFSGAGKTTLLTETLKNLEHVELIKSYTATPLSEVKRCLENGKNPILEIDFNGYQKILNCGLFDRSDIQSLFVVVPADEISRRLCRRDTEDLNGIVKRMLTAVEESKGLDCYDVVLKVEDYWTSVKKLEKFFSGEQISSDPFDIEFFEKEVKLLTGLYLRGIALQYAEYNKLEEYYEEKNMPYEHLAVLGAKFTGELMSMGDHATFGVIHTLLSIAVALKRQKRNHYAERIYNFAADWAEEDHLVGSEQYPFLGQWLEDVRGFLEDDKEYR